MSAGNERAIRFACCGSERMLYGDGRVAAASSRAERKPMEKVFASSRVMRVALQQTAAGLRKPTAEDLLGHQLHDWQTTGQAGMVES
jgi:hypothetical protein